MSKKQLPDWLPLAIGVALVVQFVGLGAWQINRGLEKRAQQELYSDDAGFTNWTAGVDVRPYQRLRIRGKFDAEHQVLLENIILNSRYGYYVVTPIRVSYDNQLVLVNRGWIEKTGERVAPEALVLPPGEVVVHGRAGSLPRAGYRMGDPISPGFGWPKYAVYPNLEEIAALLDSEVAPFVLLMDPDDEYGFLRHWVPEEMGPGRHFAYALQWFAMGAVLAALLVWHSRRRRAQRG